MMHGHEKSDLVIVAMKPANKAKKATWGGVCGGGRSGVGGAKGGGQGEYAPAKHVLDSEPESRVKGAGAYTATCAVTPPEAGAVCGKAARMDLGGGRAMKRASLPLLKRLAFITLLGGAAAPLHKSYIRCSNFVRIAAISSLSLRRHFLSRARTSSVVGSSPDSMR
jgi:hypothetical protein